MRRKEKAMYLDRWFKSVLRGSRVRVCLRVFRAAMEPGHVDMYRLKTLGTSGEHGPLPSNEEMIQSWEESNAPTSKQEWLINYEKNMEELRKQEWKEYVPKQKVHKEKGRGEAKKASRGRKRQGHTQKEPSWTGRNVRQFLKLWDGKRRAWKTVELVNFGRSWIGCG